MKKLFACLMVGMIAVAIAFAGCAAPAPAPTPSPTPAPTPAQTVEFKLNIAVPGPQQPSVWEPTQRFIKSVAEKTNGRVKVTIFPNFGLAPGPETFDATVKGICDLGEANTGYSPGRFPATDATILPLGYPSSVVQSHVMMDFYDKFKPKEWEGVIALDFITPPPFWLATTKKPVRTLDDLKGLQVRVTSKPAADLLTLMGAAPRVIPITETYEQLAKGVMDGVTAGPEAFPAFKFNEVCKYFTDFSHIAMGNCSYLIANTQTFAKLSAADQKLMRELCVEFGLDRAKTWDQYNDTEIANLKKAEGKETITMATAEQEKMRALAQKVVDDYIKATEAKGLPAAEYVKYVKERIDFWSKQK